MKKYEIDYGQGVADFWTSVEPDEVLPRFMERANDCFGLRKSITKGPEVVGVTEESMPAPWGQMPEAAEMLVHNKPISDIIVWNHNGEKIKNEWD